MNRRQLFALGTGLVVGEPVRRAYSFLNGFGLESQWERDRRLIDRAVREAVIRHCHAGCRVKVNRIDYSLRTAELTVTTPAVLDRISLNCVL